ncbi:hypothetical protein [uncultured Streptomyces sp.]|uniref:hypothetical protein n=1 Tax=uncultured Streptomyces sp. TaxID=174707 RepID=UPI002617E2C5|nr:hypothetical protein [uncultured Streptomyces sp.]
MRTAPRTLATSVCALSLLATLAACGSGTQDGAAGGRPDAASSAPKKKEPFAGVSGPELTDKAMEATRAATSLRIKLDMTTTDGPVKADFASAKSGECTGTLHIGTSGAMDVVKIGGTAWTRMDEAMLREQLTEESAADVDATVDLLAGRWTEAKTSDPDVADTLGFCDLESLLGGFEGGDTEAKRGAVTTHAGQPAIELSEKDGKETYTFLVAAKGEPRLLRLVSRGGEEPMTMELSDFDRPVEAKKPAAKDIVDLD